MARNSLLSQQNWKTARLDPIRALGTLCVLGPVQQCCFQHRAKSTAHCCPLNRHTRALYLCRALGTLHPTPKPCACRCGQANTRFVFVPGPGDPGPGNVLPRPPLPAALTGALRAALPSAEFASNPCRLRHYMQVCSGCRAAAV